MTEQKNEEVQEVLKKSQIDVELAIKNSLSPILTQINQKESEEKKQEDFKSVLKSTIEEMKINQPLAYYIPNHQPRLTYNRDRFSEITETGRSSVPAQMPMNESMVQTREQSQAKGPQLPMNEPMVQTRDYFEARGAQLPVNEPNVQTRDHHQARGSGRNGRNR